VRERLRRSRVCISRVLGSLKRVLSNHAGPRNSACIRPDTIVIVIAYAASSRESRDADCLAINNLARSNTAPRPRNSQGRDVIPPFPHEVSSTRIGCSRDLTRTDGRTDNGFHDYADYIGFRRVSSFDDSKSHRRHRPRASAAAVSARAVKKHGRAHS